MKSKESLHRRLIKPAIAIGLSLNAFGGCGLFSTENENPALAEEVRNVADQNRVKLLGVEVDCPDGGSSIEQSMVVQAPENPGDINARLFAIKPKHMYVEQRSKGGDVIVFCGKDYGSHGERFEGNALIPYSADSTSATIIDADQP